MLPVPKLYRNKITIVVEDADLERGTITINSKFDTRPNIEKGPQTPAEQVAAMAMMFMVNYATSEKTTDIITPEDFAGMESNEANRKEILAALIHKNLKQQQ